MIPTGLLREKHDFFLALATVFGFLNKGGSGAPEHLLKTVVEWLTNQFTQEKEV